MLVCASRRVQYNGIRLVPPLVPNAPGTPLTSRHQSQISIVSRLAGGQQALNSQTTPCLTEETWYRTPQGAKPSGRRYVKCSNYLHGDALEIQKIANQAFLRLMCSGKCTHRNPARRQLGMTILQNKKCENKAPKAIQKVSELRGYLLACMYLNAPNCRCRIFSSIVPLCWTLLPLCPSPPWTPLLPPQPPLWHSGAPCGPLIPPSFALRKLCPPPGPPLLP